MKHPSILFAFCLAAFTASAAVPTYNDFNGNQFSSNVFKVNIKSGALMTNASFYKGSGAATITLIEETGESASVRIGSFDISADGQTLTFTELGGPSTIFSYNVATDTFHIDEKVLISEQLTVATGQDGEAIYQAGGGTNYFDASTYFASNVYVRAISASNAVPSRVAFFNAANLITNVNLAATAIVRANGTAVTIGSGLSDNGTTLSATGGGSGDTNAISYMPDLINAARTRTGAGDIYVFDVARYTNGHIAIVVTNALGDDEAVNIKSASGNFSFFQATRDGSTIIDSEGDETIIQSGGQDWLYASSVERRISDVNGVEAANFRDKDLPIFGNAWTLDLATFDEYDFLVATGDGKIIGTNTLNLSALNVTGNLTVGGQFIGNGTGLTNVSKTTYSATLGTDDTHSGASINGLNAGATIAQWEAVYMGSGGEWLLADANGSGTYPALGLAITASTDNNPLNVAVAGTVRNDAWNWTIGGTVYISATPGALTQTAPSTTGDKVQIVGFALTADILYLNPSTDYGTAP